MLAGLLFAIEEAVQPPGRLVATLPFAGTTLIEHQARQLVSAGAGQIVVIGDRHIPDLAGALHRIGRRGVAVDAVSSVVEAVTTIHPLSRLLMLADGLVAADATVAAMAAEGGEALLVVPGSDAPSGFERIGGASAWAGLARIDPGRVAEVAALPADYAPQSTLLRVAEAGGAVRIGLPPQALVDGHGIERATDMLDRRGQRLVSAAVAMRHGWFDRWLAAPLARLVMPALVGAGVSGSVVTASIVVTALFGAGALAIDWWRPGVVLALAATLGCGPAASLGILREERPVAAAAINGAVAIPLATVLLLGWRATVAQGNAVPAVVAIALVVAALLGQRASGTVRRWWGSAPAYLMVSTVLTLAGWPLTGLALATCYAGATLAAAIEKLRGDARRQA